MDIFYIILAFLGIAYVLLADFIKFKDGKFTFSITVSSERKPYNIKRFVASILFIFSLSAIANKELRVFSTIGVVLMVMAIQTTLGLISYKKTKNKRALWGIGLIDGILVIILIVFLSIL